LRAGCKWAKVGCGVEFRILGPLEVLDGDRRVELGGHKQRALLAVLLLNANEVVSQDRLADELWGETPPATAVKTLQAHVSRLRKALHGGGVTLETRGPGYVLRVDAEDIDSEVFRTKLEQARRALADGKPEEAAPQLREALALWRGPPLTDFAYEPFAQSEIAHLEEIRLAALEERNEAELALGHHEALVPELEALVAAHPLRERLLGQLMLALYRSGRQAEALHAYERGRQLLATELGLAPSAGLQQLHRQILEQDEALAAPARKRPPVLVPEIARRHPRRVAVAGALLLAAAIGAAVFQLTRNEEMVGTSGALLLDPGTGHVVDAVPLGTAPSNVAIGEGGVWVVDRDNRAISEIDPQTRRVARTFSTAGTPTDVAVGAGAVWITNADVAESVLPASVSRFDPQAGAVVDTIELARRPGGHQYSVFPGFTRQHVAATHEAVWVINQDQSVSRIDPQSNRVVARIRNVKAENVAAGDGDVWVTEDTTLTEIDPRLNRVSRRISIPADKLTALDVGGGAVWVADPLGGKIWRVDTGSRARRLAIPVAMWTGAISFGEGVVWAANEIRDEIQQIDARTNAARVVGKTAAPRDIEAAGGAVWVTATSPPSRDAALPQAVCGEVFYRGEGEPEFLLVSDLPLKGGARTATLAMVEAIRFVLERRGFEAGGHGVGYQSCDSSTAQGDIDLFRCALNAKAYARNLKVAGVFGAYTSPCSFAQIPITNEAPGGPLAMVSPSNTVQELTEDKTLYPRGVRNYVRIAAADHLQAVGQAVLAKRIGTRRLVLLWPQCDDYAAEFARRIHLVARNLGVAVAGSATYDCEGADFTALGRSVAAKRPDAVAVGGFLTPASGAVIRDLRATLGPRVALIAPDGFAMPDIDDLLDLTGSGANGLYLTQYGVPNGRLSAQGRRFLASFAASRGTGPGPDFAAAYGAQGAEILLDAIARSDGTRSSVTRELRRTRVDDGILGDIRFDRNGDLVEAPVTVYRVDDKRYVVTDVITARAALLKR
jgi:DNA-binding SARP family transcriptional activator/ABC-type branched-subunit amino acid transport system substrate-binding protein